MTNRQKNYEIGYRHGSNGLPIKDACLAYAGYEEGYNDGRADLNEEVADYNHENSDRCLS